MRLSLSLLLLLSTLEGISGSFVPIVNTGASTRQLGSFPIEALSISTLVKPKRIWGTSSYIADNFMDYRSSDIYAKPKKISSDVTLNFDDIDEEPLSLKDQIKAKKDADKNSKKTVDTNNKKKDAESHSPPQLDAFDDDEPLSMKDKIKLQKQAEKATKKGGVVVEKKNIETDLYDDDDEPLSMKEMMKMQKEVEKTSKKTPNTTANKNSGKMNSDLDFLDIDEPLSMKEKIKLQREAEKNGKKAEHLEPNHGEESRIETKMEDSTVPRPGKQDSKSKALKALELMERVEAQMVTNEIDAPPKLSKKELKELEKIAAKKAMKEAKKGAKVDLIEQADDDAIESSLDDAMAEVS